MRCKVIAEILRANKPEVTGMGDVRVKAQWLRIVDALAYKLAKDNPRFNAEKFREACGQCE